MWGRIFSNTIKHIKRSGWIGWGSAVVMTLAFLITSIFGGLAYVSNLYIKFIERKSNLLVFFDVGMDTTIVNNLKNQWREYSEVKDISYTTEEQAFSIYADYTAKVNPETYAVLQEQDTKKLPSSLDIQIWSLDDLSSVQTRIQRDIDAQLEDLIIIDTSSNKTTTDSTTDTTTDSSSTTTTTSTPTVRYQYAQDPTQAPITLRVDSENLQELKDVFFALRIAGLFIISLLLIVVFIFIFMISEFRLYNQREEIGVMQLVGGSLFFIRAPYILEGAFYGLIGSVLSSLTIGLGLAYVFILKESSTITTYLYKNFGKLPWPHMGIFEWGIIVLGLILVGIFLGAISSYLSIRRYIR